MIDIGRALRCACVVAVTCGTLMLLAAPDDAFAGRRADYPWCTQFQDFGGAFDCSYVSLQQCLVSLSGVGGNCIVNPRFSSDWEEPRRNVRRSARGKTIR